MNTSAQTHCLALATDAYGGRGGIAQYNRDFCSALGASGMAVTVAPRHAPDPVAPPAGVRQIRARRGQITYALSALQTAMREPVDIVFCGHLYMVTLAWVAARLKGAGLIIQMHGIEAWPRPSWLKRCAVERADLVMCGSRYTRARVLDWAAIPPERVIVVSNTVGDAFTPGDGSRFRTRQGLDGKRVLLTVGRLDARERYKGHDRVIAALPTLLTEGRDVLYLIVGEGDDRGRLQGLAQDLGVGGHVRFLGGVDRQTLVEAYREADLFVMASTGEGFGIAFLEAMASGTPALGLAAGGACDALGDGELGAVVPENDDLAPAISRLLSMPKGDARRLASATCARFGRAAFVSRVSAALERVKEAA